MNFIVSSSALSAHLQGISRVINSKNALPILDCFLFELQDGVLTVTVSDSETTMVTTLEVVESDADGRFAIAARTLLDALKEIPEQPLTFDIDLHTLELTIQYQNGKYNLVGQNADEFPTPAALSENAVRVDMDFLKAFQRAREGHVVRGVYAGNLHLVFEVQHLDKSLALFGRAGKGSHAPEAPCRALGRAAGMDDAHCVFQGQCPAGPGCGNFANTVAHNRSWRDAKACEHFGDTHLNGKKQGLGISRFLQIFSGSVQEQVFDGSPKQREKQSVHSVQAFGEDPRLGIEFLSHADPLGTVAGVDKDQPLLTCRIVRRPFFQDKVSAFFPGLRKVSQSINKSLAVISRNGKALFVLVAKVTRTVGKIVGRRCILFQGIGIATCQLAQG